LHFKTSVFVLLSHRSLAARREYGWAWPLVLLKEETTRGLRGTGVEAHAKKSLLLLLIHQRLPTLLRLRSSGREDRQRRG
jgi:hypothetical protein